MKRLLPVLLLCLVAAAAQAQFVPTAFNSGASGGSAPTFVNDTSNAASGGTGICFGGSATVCATGAISTTTGNLLWVFLYNDGTASSVTSVTDTCGTSGGASNTYTADTNTGALQSTANGYLYHTVVGFGKSCVITFTRGGTVTGNFSLYVQQVTGVNATTPVGTSQFAIHRLPSPGASANAATSNSLGSTTTQTNVYLGGAVISGQGATETITAGTGFGIHTTWYDGANMDIGGESQVLASTGTTPATFTLGTGTAPTVTVAIAIQHP